MAKVNKMQLIELFTGKIELKSIQNDFLTIWIEVKAMLNLGI